MEVEEEQEQNQEAASPGSETKICDAQDYVDPDQEHKARLAENGPETSVDKKLKRNSEESLEKQEGAELTLNELPDEPEISPSHSACNIAEDKACASEEVGSEEKEKAREPETEDDTYTVLFTVTIAIAIPTVFEDGELSESQDWDQEQPAQKKQQHKQRRLFETPRAQNYYHLEYCLSPGDGEFIRTDIVTYGVAAKLFMEKHDARLLKTWQDGEITWIAWTHSFSMTITKDVLLKLYGHTMELRVWDIKEKCSARTRFDRPKAFRLPQARPGEKPEDVGGVKALVEKQIELFIQMQSPKSNLVRLLPKKCVFPRAKKKAKEEDQASAKEDSSILVAVPNVTTSGQTGLTSSRLGQLAGAKRSAQSSGGKESTASGGRYSDGQHTQSSAILRTHHSSVTSEKSSKIVSPHSLSSNQNAATSVLQELILPEESDSAEKIQTKKSKAAAVAAAEHIRQFGICVIPFPMSLLFSETQSATARLQQPVPGVEDLFITVSLDKPLLSEKNKEELNPMIITIKSATKMPDSSMSFEELSTKCQPVYCKYQFFKQPSHTTCIKEHQRNIYWDDKNVILLGTQDLSMLREYLSGPSMVIEIHDRDRKTEEVQMKGRLFGDDLEDQKISNVGTVASRRTLYNPFLGRNQPYDPYGVCRVDLSELLLGHRFLELLLPIHDCPLPDVLGLEDGEDSKLMGVAGAVDGPVERPFPLGGYMNSGATLKIQVELAHSLITLDTLASDENSESASNKDSALKCPFGRIIFMFAYKNTTMLHQLQKLIVNINALGLDMDDMPFHVIDSALSTYKLSIEQQVSKTLDIVTGFHILDGVKHIFILEGLKDQGIKRLWEELPQPEKLDVRVLYNSDLSFSRRLYSTLDVDLCRVKLHEPLHLIVQQSLLYIRDMVPKPCFQALIRLEEITRMHLMKDVVKNDMFPTAEMVLSMSKEFGVPFTAADFEELRPDWERSPLLVESETTESPPDTRKSSNIWAPLDNFNKAFVDKLIERKKGTTHDFIKENMKGVKIESRANMVHAEKSRVPAISATVAKAHNYSTQTLNSTEMANEALRTLLQKQPDTRFTHSQDFHSATVVPVNETALAQAETKASREHWLSPKGWVYPGKRTMLESNLHRLKPHAARIEELKEKWRENFLHVNYMQPPLDRDTYPWAYRHYDIELYDKAPPFFKEEPLSIHLPGVKRQAEKAEARDKEAKIWQSRVVVNDIAQHFHRLLPETEMRDAGFYSSNQIDRLTSLLKDPPEKLYLKFNSARDIPPLNVVNYPEVDTLARAQGVVLKPAVPGELEKSVRGFKPGPYTLSSLPMQYNHIPVHEYDHHTFIDKYGQDFNAVHKDRQHLWKRSITSLSGKERDNYLFRMPLAAQPYKPLPALGALVKEIGLQGFGPSMDANTTTHDLPQAVLHKRELVYV